jgi:spermidine synthase
MFRRLLSYLIPINVYQQNSAISKSIEVNWNNGELVLDSKNTNYSYGSLQRILRIGLKKIGFENIRAMESILVLGVGGGSVFKTLVDEIKFKNELIGVEIDEEMIQIANKYFNLDKIPNLTIIIDDAFEFVLKTKKTYDLIIIDIFEDTKMPNFVYEKFFMNRIGDLLNNKGFILFNTMLLDEQQNQRNLEYIKNFNTSSFTSYSIPRVERHNEIIIIQKNILQ